MAMPMGKLNVPTSTIYTGDNIDVLRGINSDCIDLIYLDPPFNSNRNYANPIPSLRGRYVGFEDIWAMNDAKEEWLEDILGSNAGLHAVITAAGLTAGDSMKGYLTFMAVRLIEMRRVLKPTGSIYLHCDPTASHYLKGVMDATFGRDNCRNEIVWGYNKPRPAKKKFVSNHDIIFFYTKGQKWTFNPQRVPTMSGRFELRDPVKRPDGTLWIPQEPGKLAGSWWYDIPSFSTRMKANERTGYPTQKPLALLERIIRASTNPDDVVLDSFCGCATTCVAAEGMTAAPNSDIPAPRRWIGIDISEAAYDLVQARMEKEVGIIDRSDASGNLVTAAGELQHKTLRYDADGNLRGGDIPKRTDNIVRLSPNIRPDLYRMQGGCCNADGESLALHHLQLDRIVSGKRKGEYVDDNVQLLCGHHNSMKGDGTMIDLDARMRARGETPWIKRDVSRITAAEAKYGKRARKPGRI